MKKRIIAMLISAVLLCTLFTGCGSKAPTGTDVPQETTEASEQTGTTAAAEQLHDTFGYFQTKTFSEEVVDQSIFEGKLTMVNIWATFCPSCISSMPEFEKLSKKYKEQGLQVVGIPCDIPINPDGSYALSSYALAEDILRRTDVSYKNLLPNEALKKAKLDSVISIPETLFLDKNGNVIGMSYIGGRSYESWCEIVEGMLENYG